MEQSSELPPGISNIELSETEDSIWNELPYKEEQAEPTLPSMLPAVSVMETPQMYHRSIILRPHRRIKHLHTMCLDFKEQRVLIVVT